jgi:predicted peptidase
MPVGGSGYRAKSGEYKIDLSKLKDLPIWMIHSAADESVSVKGADDFYRDSLEVGGNLGYTRYPDADHVETARRAYFDKTLYEWLLRQRRTLGA